MSRFSWWLPVAALVAGFVMALLALMAMRAGTARHDLALEGRILGLAHRVEAELRESGVSSAGQVLADLHQEFVADIDGFVLRDAKGAEIASAGRSGTGVDVRSVDLFLGRLATGDWGRGSGGGPHGFGRGRASLDVLVAPAAVHAPLATRLVFPAAVAVGMVLVGLAFYGARLVERNRRLEIVAVDRRRLESLARAGAGLAHQLRTPLATIKGSCQLIDEQVSDERLSQRVQTAVREAERMERTLGMLLDYARPPRPEPCCFPVAEALTRLTERWPDLEVEIPGDVMVFADSGHVQEMLANLVENAVQAAPTGTKVSVRAKVEGNRCKIEVLDQGPGPGSDPEELFEPYFTGRADGTGLGLPISRTLAEVNGGSVRLGTGSSGGCIARVLLPVGES